MSEIRIQKRNSLKNSKPMIIIPKIIVPPIKIGDMYLEVPSNYYNKSSEDKKLGVVFILLQKIQSQPINYDIWDKYTKSLSILLDKELAIRLIESLPFLAIYEEFLTDEKAKNTTIETYSSIKQWLWQNHKSIVTNNLQEHPVYSKYESLAMTSKYRYDMINALFSRSLVNINIFYTPEVAWILSEVAIFWKRVLNKTDCRNQLCLNGRKYLNTLKSLEPEDNIYFNVTSVEEFLDHVDTHFETLARKRVQSGDSDFEELYFKHYINAERHWNNKRNTRNWKLVLANGKKPYSRPGPRPKK